MAMLNMLFRVRADIHAIGCTNTIMNTLRGKWQIKYTWDGKYEKVDKEQLVQELVQGERKTKRTNFYRG